jgi:hypothetical protein
MITSMIHGHAERRHSYELVAAAFAAAGEMPTAAIE